MNGPPAFSRSPSELHVQLLGGFSIALGEVHLQEAGIRSRRARSLIKLLALASGHRLHRDQVIDTLWPEADLSAATNSLHQTLYTARKTLDPLTHDCLALEEGILSLSGGTSGTLSVDVDQFETAATRATGSDDLQLYQTALAQYTGELLPADRYEAWTMHRRAALQQVYLKLLFNLARLQEANQDYPAGSETLQRLLETDPAHEEAHVALMRLYALSGHRQQALRQFQTLSEVLQAEMEVEPGPAARQLYEAIQSGRFGEGLTPTSPPTPSPLEGRWRSSLNKSRGESSKNLTPESSEAAPGEVLPTGTVTFLFTDIVGSTPLWESQPQLMADALQIHNAALGQTIMANGGVVFKTVGDTFQAAFPTALLGLQAAIEGQQALQAATWNELGALSVRMGLHTGEAALDLGGNEYAVSHAKNRIGRIHSIAHGGQILLSAETYMLVNHQLPPGVTLQDMGEHHLKGLLYPEHLYQVNAPGLPADFPPLASETHPSHNLPLTLTRFIGRQAEIAQVQALLRENRLVTLTGSGGVGKTRLSIQAAGELLADFPDGIWYVELAPISDPKLVPQTVVSVLGLYDDPNHTPLEVLSDFLKTRALLLVLDNGEHLLAACAQLTDTLLHHAPSLKILISSREVLGIAGEHPFRVPSLSIPDPRQLPAPEALQGYEAVELFAEHARITLPSFQITAHNAQSVAQICQRLDGIPLALELAAARLNILTTEQLAARLDKAFRLLTGGSRTALPRQQTLRGAIDWSYQLLSESERLLLCRLAVFAGGAALEGIEAVCAGEGLEADDILDLLSSLVNKSMVEATHKQGTETWYRLLETVRQYAGERLATEKLLDSGEHERLQDRHLEYFVGWAEALSAALSGPDPQPALHQFELEHDNLRAALDWAAADASRATLGLRLAAACGEFWINRGYFREGRQRLAAALTPPQVQDQSAVRAEALVQAASLAYWQADYPGGQPLVEQALKIWRELGQSGQAGLAHALYLYSSYRMEVGDFPNAVRLYQESLDQFTQMEDIDGMGAAYTGLGWCAIRTGEYALAQSHLEQALLQAQASGTKKALVFASSGLGEVAVRLGQYRRAKPFLEQALALSRQIGDRWLEATILGSLGWVALRQRQFAGMREWLAQSMALRLEIGDQGGIAWCLEKLAEAALQTGQLRQAAVIFGAAAALRKPIQSVIDPTDVPEYERMLADLHTRLPADDYQAAWEEGQVLPLKQVVAAALATVASAPQ